MKKEKVALIIAVLLAGSAAAQTSRSVGTMPSVVRTVPTSPATINRPPSPQLNNREPASIVDESATDGRSVFTLRSGSHINIRPATGSALIVALPSAISTKGMTGVQMNRPMSVTVPVYTSEGVLLIPVNSIVDTSVSGYASGMLDRAALVLEPRTVFVDIPVAAYVAVESGNRAPVYLKPGKWKFEIHATIQSIQGPEGQSWYAKSENEPKLIGPKFGSERREGYSTGDRFDGLLYLPSYGAVAYGFFKIGNLFGLLFHRPNLILPAKTEVFYRLDRVEATYLLPPSPVGPARILYQQNP